MVLLVMDRHRNLCPTVRIPTETGRQKTGSLTLATFNISKVKHTMAECSAVYTTTCIYFLYFFSFKNLIYII